MAELELEIRRGFVSKWCIFYCFWCWSFLKLCKGFKPKCETIFTCWFHYNRCWCTHLQERFSLLIMTHPIQSKKEKLNKIYTYMSQKKKKREKGLVYGGGSLAFIHFSLDFHISPLFSPFCGGFLDCFVFFSSFFSFNEFLMITTSTCYSLSENQVS